MQERNANSRKKTDLMRTARLFGVLFFLFLPFFCLTGCHNTIPDETKTSASDTAASGTAVHEVSVSASSPRRIISTVPSITETLFALGLGDRVVAVSRFCTHPPEVRELPKVGGLFDPDWETMARLRADVAVTLDGNESYIDKLQRLGIEVLAVDHKGFEGVLDSFARIGRRFGPEYEARGEELRREIDARLERVRRRTAPLPKPRVLICIDRTRGVGKIQNLFIAGNNPFFDRVLEIAGGINVGRNPENIAVPTLSTESVLRLNPEVIFDLLTGVGEVASAEPEGRTRLLRTTVEDWNSVGEHVDAVRNGRVYLITEDYATVPGPRIADFVEHLARLLHPESPVFSENPAVTGRDL